MTHAVYHATFSGSDNQGVQVGYNTGNIENHHHYPTGKSLFSPLKSHYGAVLTAGCAERPETPPSPLLSIPFLRDPDFVDRGTVLNQLRRRCATPGSRTAFVGFGGVGYDKSLCS
jgi:hypothetical protein